MQLPQKLLSSLEGIDGFNKEAFIDVHNSGAQVTSIRINPLKISIPDFPFPNAERVPWTQFGYHLNNRPSFTFDPLFHAGCYYVQDASSMFLEQALQQTADLSQPLKLLDLCAAPGGKSTHIQSLISAESLLISNEVIKARAGSLKQNIIKWGCGNVIVTSNDPQHFKKMEGFFDVLIVDAPCSGSGLFRKDAQAINEWSPDSVQHCSQRQQRILADALPCLKENGILIYATCSYSVEEDEDIADMLVMQMKMESIPLKIIEEWGVVETHSKDTQASCYRFYSDKVKGEGFFLSCFQKNEPAVSKKYKQGKPTFLSLNEREALQPWIIENDDLAFLKHEQFIFAWPQTLVSDLLLIQWSLYIQYAGTNCGELVRDKMIPDHALAMSQHVSMENKVIALSYEEAITYLQRGDLKINSGIKSWQLVSYQNHPLGWINALHNRINNYYPKEMRILKAQNDSSFEK